MWKTKVEKKKQENTLLTSSAQLHWEFATELMEDHFFNKEDKIQWHFPSFSFDDYDSIQSIYSDVLRHRTNTEGKELVCALQADIRPVLHSFISNSW